MEKISFLPQSSGAQGARVEGFIPLRSSIAGIHGLDMGAMARKDASARILSAHRRDRLKVTGNGSDGKGLTLCPSPRPDLDLCECGDFRRDHTEKGCKLCKGLGNGTAGMIPPCRKFKFSQHCSSEEISRQEQLEQLIYGKGTD